VFQLDSRLRRNDYVKIFIFYFIIHYSLIINHLPHEIRFEAVFKIFFSMGSFEIFFTMERISLVRTSFIVDYF